MKAVGTARAPRGLLFLLAVTAGCAMASNYLLQPLLPEIARTFPREGWIAGAAAGAAPIGYVAGLIFLVPLGDAIRIRTLLVGQCLALALAMTMAAIARDPMTLTLSLAAGGTAATVTAHCIGFAGRIALERQGRAVGSVVMGVSIGILAGRILSGSIGEALGWRAPFGFAALAAIVSAGLLRAMVPDQHAVAPGRSLRAHLLAVPVTLIDDPSLRRLVIIGGCWFAAFSIFWATLAFQLAAAPLGYGSAVAGGFGFIGIVGAFVARLAGQGSDRWGANAMIAVGLICALAGFVLLAIFPSSLPAIAGGALLMDAGCFGANAAMQAHILAANGPNRSGRYGAYMTAYWTAGAIGAFLGPPLFFWTGWSLLMVLCAVIILTGLLIHVDLARRLGAS